MKQKQDILHSMIIEVTMVLLASMVAFQVCNMLGIRMSLIPLVMVIGYVIQKLLYHLCIISARYIVDAIPPSFLISVKKCVSKRHNLWLIHLPQTVKKSRKANGVISL